MEGVSRVPPRQGRRVSAHLKMELQVAAEQRCSTFGYCARAHYGS
jgi:hypothetical protein